MSAEDLYAFQHAVLRDACYQLQPPSERALLHWHAFHSLQRPQDGEVHPRSVELLHHILASASAPLPPAQQARRAELEASCLLRAAEFARLQMQWSRAHELYTLVEAHSAVTGQGRATARFGRAEILRLTGDARKALPMYEQLLTDPETAPALRTKLSTSLAACEFLLGDTARAEKLLRDAAINGPDARSRAVNRGILGIILRRQGKLTEAEATMRDSIEAWRTLGDPIARANEEANLANVLRDAGRLDEAIALYQATVREFLEFGAAGHAATQLSNLGSALMDARRQDEAERALHQAIALLREHGPARMLGIALGNMASLETSRGKYAVAQQLLKECLSLLEPLQEKALLGAFRSELARSHLLCGAYAEAQTLLLRADRELQECGAVLTRMANTLPLLSRLALARAERSEALEYLRLAVAMADDLRLPPDSPQREIIRSTGAALEAADTHLVHGHLPEEIGG
ncbi:MAG: tetratricopeptide repeat protein [Planctomycetes bacterium]|nr:tetratricopeptide repeat protein [Planctomycetota bacterium]